LRIGWPRIARKQRRFPATLADNGTIAPARCCQIVLLKHFVWCRTSGNVWTFECVRHLRWGGGMVFLCHVVFRPPSVAVLCGHRRTRAHHFRRKPSHWTIQYQSAAAENHEINVKRRSCSRCLTGCESINRSDMARTSVGFGGDLRKPCGPSATDRFEHTCKNLFPENS